MSTSFLRLRPWHFAHVFSVPLPSLQRCYFFFSSDIWVFVCFGDVWVLRDPTFSAIKKKKKHWEKARQGHIEHVYKISGSLKNGVDIWTFVQLRAKITAWHRNYLVLVYIRFWALILTQYWSYAVSSSTFCAKFCTNMPWSTWKRMVQKKKWVIFFLSTVNSYLLLISLKVCDWSGHIFGASTSPRSFTKKMLCHPLPLFMAVSMIPNMWHSSCYCMRHSWLTQFGVLCLNQLVKHSAVHALTSRVLFISTVRCMFW